MEPVYRNIEFCRNAETLWGKLREGRWDWLGVHPDGKYVLGSPRRGNVWSDHASVVAVPAGVDKGQNGVRVETEPGRQYPASKLWFGSPEEARARFEQEVDGFRSHRGPLIAKIELIIDGAIESLEYVVANPPTYR